ncbi:hypothetical protein AMS62_09710 [Bacillus sp. FJAT-18019]|nr:hypothetical protein AMS62_09710 [Bacillus sp. FJAT-18019]
MNKKRRSFFPYIAFILMISILITPESAALGQRALANLGNSSASQTTVSDAVYSVLPTRDLTHLDQENIETISRFTEDQLQQIRTQFTPEMLQLAAFFYPELNQELTTEQILVKQSWDEQHVYQQYRQLSPAQQKLLKELTPLVALSAEYDADPSVLDDIVKPYTPSVSEDVYGNITGEGIPSVTVDVYGKPITVTDDVYGNHSPMSLMAMPTPDKRPSQVSDKSESYKYQESTDEAVDPVYRASNRTSADLSLLGRNGLNVSLVRSYSSLNAKITDPTYSNKNLTPEQILQCRNHITYFTNESDCLGNIPETAWMHADPNFIATGWSLNIPTMTKSFQDSIEWLYVPSAYQDPGSPQFHLTDFYSRKYGSTEEDQELTFQLDDGNTYTFQGTSKQPLKHPYSNVTYRVEGNRYFVTVGDQITYEFLWDAITGSGQIVSKSNAYGDRITYTYLSNRLLVTDTAGRTVEVAYEPIQPGHSAKRITGVTAKTATGTLLYDIRYQAQLQTLNTSLRTFLSDASESYGVQSISTSYVKLNTVWDAVANRTLETYTYYDPNSVGTHADFNMEDDYKFKNVAPNVPALEADNYESSDIVSRDQQTYGELAYYLLKSVEDDTGLKTQYEYGFYDPSWTSISNYTQRSAARGTGRMYLDPWVLTYVGYHPVLSVSYSYESLFTGEKLLLTAFSGTKEIWKSSQAYSGRLAASLRFGDRVRTDVTQNMIDYQDKQTFMYRANKWGVMLLRNQIQETQTPANLLDTTEGNSHFRFAPKEVVTYTYDEDNAKTKPLSISQSVQGLDGVTSGNISSQYVYDDYGYVISATDELGNLTTIQYGGPKHQISYHKMQSIDGAVTEETTYNYNSDATLKNVVQRSSYRDPGNGEMKTDTIETMYSQFNNFKQPQHIETRSSGDQLGALMTQKTMNQYSADGLHVTQKSQQVTLQTGATPTAVTTRYEYDTRNRMIKSTLPDGSTTNYSYDAKNRLTQETFAPVTGSENEARTAKYTYNDDSRTLIFEKPDGVKLYTYYSPYGDVEKKIQESSSTQRILEINILNETGHLIKEHQPFGEADKKIQFVYGANGQIWRSINALNQESVYSYANAAQQAGESAAFAQTAVRQVDPDGKETTTYSDRYGRIEKVVENSPTKTRTTSYTYDARDRVVREQVTSGSQTQTTLYGYDAFDRLIYVKDNVGIENTYNVQGEVTQVLTNGIMRQIKNYNESGWLLSSANASGQTETYKYSNMGLVSEHKDKAGQIHQMTYTPYYEVQRLSVRKNGTEVYWSENSYEPVKRLVTGISNSENENISYSYDIWNRMNSQTVAGKTYTFGYNDLDLLTSVTYPDQKQTSYSYDPLLRVKSVTYPDMGTVNYTYTVGANANDYTLSYPNNQSQVRRTDAFGELVSVNFGSGSNAWRETVGYDGLGNISTITKNGAQYKYTYDGVNRIQQESWSEGENRYTYDDRGNRTNLESSTLPEPVEGSEGFTYNALNQLKTYTKPDMQASYSYYGDGLRASKTVNGQLTRYVYLNGHAIDELDNAGNSKARNIWGNELLFRKDENSGKGGYYYYNSHGDVVAVKDSAGNSINTYTYDIWGKVQQKTEGMSNPFRYTGEIYDDESGLIYLRARYYDPEIGRFITEDTYEGELNNPLSLNLYTYVTNNPLIYIDPSGNKAWLIHGTWSNPEKSWGKDDSFDKYVEGLFNESSERLEWSGGNSTGARSETAEEIFKKVYEWRLENPNDPIRLVGHSHGGNVAIMVANLLAEKGMEVETLITIATPVREYQLDKNTSVVQHIHLYNNIDLIQANGGSAWLGGYTLTREFYGAENVRVTDAEKPGVFSPNGGPIDAHSSMHSNIKIWKKYIEPKLKKKN